MILNSLCEEYVLDEKFGLKKYFEPLESEARTFIYRVQKQLEIQLKLKLKCNCNSLVS